MQSRFLVNTCWIRYMKSRIEEIISFSVCLAAKSCLTLRPHGLWCVRLPCPSLSPGIYSDSSPLSRWCHLIISSSVTRFSLCLQSFLASESFLMSCLLAPGGQSIEPETSASVLSINIQGRFPLGLTGLISFQYNGLRVFSNITVQKHPFFSAQPSV